MISSDKSNTHSSIKTLLKTEIKMLNEQTAGKFLELLRVFRQTFDTGKIYFTRHHHLRKLVDDPHFIVLVAMQNERVVGGLTAHVLANYTNPQPAVYLYDLAVHPDHQRQGVGKKLVAALIEYCTAKGYAEIFVQAEADDKEAIRFYRSTPISGQMNATQFFYTIKK
jgi:aminoglycoside 3-N-acetyltransferase I